MKKLTAFIFLISIVGFFAVGSKVSAYVGEPNRPLCLEIKGTFYANGWTGGDVEVGCGGDWGHAITDPAKRPSQACNGEVQTVAPNGKFTLVQCSCHGTGQVGCLYIAQKLHVSTTFDANHQSQVKIDTPLSDVAAFKNNKCTLTADAKVVTDLKAGKTAVCGTNGAVLSKAFKISCNTPFVPTVTPVCTGPTTYKCTSSTNCEQYTFAYRNGVCVNGGHQSVALSYCGGTCSVPTPTFTPTPTPTVTPTPTLTPTPIITSTPTPTPIGVCPVPSLVQNVKITCPNCLQQSPASDTNGGTQ